MRDLLPRFGLILLPALLAAVPATQPATLPATLPATTRAATGPATSPSTLPGTLPATRLTTKPATRPADVQAMLDHLGADAFADRERAQRALIARGPSIKPDVEELAKSTADPEVRSRAAAVLRGLEREARFGQSRVTLHLAKVNPKKAFDALAAAAGGTFTYEPDDPWGANFGNPIKPLTVDADHEPFWAVFRRLAVASEADVQQWGGDGKFTIRRTGQADDYPACVSGPFVAELHQIGWDDSRSVDLNHFDPKHPNAADHSAGRSLNLQFYFAAEPKLTVLSALSTPELTEATDDRGRSLLPAGPAAQSGMNGQDGFVWQCTAPLDAAAAAGAKRIKTLRGTTRVEVASEVKTLAIDPLAVGKTAEVAGVRVTVTALDGTGQQASLGLKIVRPAPGATGRDDLRVNAIRVLDAEGHPLPQNGGNSSDDGQTYTMDYTYQRPPGVGPPAKLTWALPTGRETLELPFEFHDLPLP